MAEVMVKRSLAKQVRERAVAGLCLHCDGTAKKRGLCSKHYEQFRRARDSMATRERVDWEIERIKKGTVLNVGESSRLKSTNPFTTNGD